MRASSSWIKLQFVVRKHVMNTYQIHTFSLFILSQFLDLTLPLAISFFFCLLVLLVVLLVCYIDVSYSATKKMYNIPIFVSMHMYILKF